MSNALRMEKVSAGYGHSLVVRGLSIHVDHGEVVALLGRNGAGKTTTLLTISGLVRAHSGSVVINDNVVRPGRPTRVARMGVAHVPEERALFKSLTVRDNLVVAGAKGSGDFARVWELFHELEPMQHRRAGVLSGGEQQMLALARAVIQHPRLLLVDEMSFGLAPLICQRLVEVLHRLARNDGVGVLLVEQHLKIALDAADRGYVVRKGHVVLEGTSAELADKRDVVHAAYISAESPTNGSAANPAASESTTGGRHN